MSAIEKTNAVRFLDRAKIAYELKSYEVDLEDLSAESVARKIGFPEEKVFKTLLMRGDKKGLLFAVVAAGTEIDPKRVAKASGDKKCELVALKEVEPLTGYVRGGVTVFAAKKTFPVIIDESALEQDVISVSAGARGTQIILTPTDYIKAAKAKTASIARAKNESE